MKRAIYNKKIARKLLFFIIIISAFFSFLATFIQLYSEYTEDLSLTEERLQQIKNSSSDSILLSLWNVNENQLKVQLKNLLKFPDVTYVKVIDENEVKLDFGDPTDENVIEKQYILTYGGKYLGTLFFQANLSIIQSRIFHRLVLIFGTQIIKTFIVSFLILYIVAYLITEHLSNMAEYAHRFNPKYRSKKLILNRKNEKDEMQAVVDNMNMMNDAYFDELEELQKTKSQIQELNSNLEKRIKKRTQELEDNLIELKNTQKKLYEVEKQASLSNLIAGLAHEMNTPLGVIVTINSIISELIVKLKESALKGDRQAFEKNHKKITDSNALAIENSTRLVSLIRQFKKLSLNEQEQEISNFDLISLIKDISSVTLNSTPQYKIDFILKSKLKAILIHNYFKIVYQVLEGLFQNSTKHAFKDEGVITITVEDSGNKVKIYFSDNGIGIPQNIQKDIFEPFTTTKLNKGSIGLGLHLCYNLANQKLGGTLSLEGSSNKGTTFLLTVSKEIVV